jgi:hypothetical protein
MTDTERLDAIGEYGLCVTTHDTLRDGQWYRQWVCQYGEAQERLVVAPSIREAIDAAVLDLRTNEQVKH